MTCSDFETIIIEIARDRLMDAATRERGLEHIRRCTPCATLLVEERALSRDLRALSARGAGADAQVCSYDCRAATTPLVAGRGRARFAHIRYFAVGMDRVVSQGRGAGDWYDWRRGASNQRPRAA